MPESIITVIVSAGIAFGIAVGSIAAARRAGLSDVDAVVREQRGALVETLRARVDHLENENKRLTAENEYLRRELDQLRAEVQRLERYIIKHKVGDVDG